MEEYLEYKYYSAKDIKEWLYHNISNGLCEMIISKVRAYSLVNHPHVTDDTVILSVIFIDGKVAGYTGIFPEINEKPQLDKTYYWGTTLFVVPEYEGRALGYLVMMHIKEACNYRYLSLESSHESVYIDKKQGSLVRYYDRYKFRYRRRIRITNARSFISATFETKRKVVQFIHRRKVKREISKQAYSLEYINYIDDSLYDFIKSHSNYDLFLRTQGTFNWLLRYPFIVSTPLIKRTKSDYAFASKQKMCQNLAVKVLNDKILIGFYIIQMRESNLSMLYLYYDEKFSDLVFYSIIEHLIYLRIKDFRTFNAQVNKFLHDKKLHLWKTVEKISFTYPGDFPVDTKLQIQGADGDMLI